MGTEIGIVGTNVLGRFRITVDKPGKTPRLAQEGRHQRHRRPP